MNHALLALAGYDDAKRQAEDDAWRATAECFLGHVRKNALAAYPEGASCDVPDEQLMNAARMQWEIRCLIENSLRYADGTNFRRFLNAMHGTEKWKLKAALPALPRLELQPETVLARVDAGIDRLDLSQPTRAWYRAHYRGIMQRTRATSELALRNRGAETMFGELTGASPRGRLYMLFLPHSVHFRCQKKEDFGLLAYPKATTASLLERREEMQACRGVQLQRELPAALGGGLTAVTAENHEVTQGNDAFGTLEHEHEHAVYAFAAHPSTMLGTPPGRETGLEFLARTATGAMLKDEYLAWSLRPHVELDRLFVGPAASYDPVKARAREMRDAKKDDQVPLFSTTAAEYLHKLAPEAAAALKALMLRYPRGIVREAMRTRPVHTWKNVAVKLAK